MTNYGLEFDDKMGNCAKYSILGMVLVLVVANIVFENNQEISTKKVAKNNNSSEAININPVASTFGYNPESRTYYEMLTSYPNIVNISCITKISEYGPVCVNKDIAFVWEMVNKSNIHNKKYTLGKDRIMRGTTEDPEEMTCYEFAILTTNLINQNASELDKQSGHPSNFSAKVVSILGTYTKSKVDTPGRGWGDRICHALVAIENRNKPIIYNTENGIQTEYEMTLLDPQTMQVGNTGSNFAGTEMVMGNYSYRIEAAQYVTEAKVLPFYQYNADSNRLMISSTKGGFFTQIAHNKTFVLNEIQNKAAKNGGNETILRGIRLNPWFTTPEAKV